MAHAFTLAELVNLAIGTPEVGVCNFNALHALLHGMLEHLHIGEVTRMVDKEEKEFIKPEEPVSPTPRTVTTAATATEEQQALTSTPTPTPTPAPTPKPEVGKSLFHQLEEKVSKLQTAFEALNQLPTAADLLGKSASASQTPAAARVPSNSGAVRDMWQLIQLKKKTEANEDGINKVMLTLQELMNEINAMSSTNERLRKEVDKFNSSKLQSLDEQLKAMHNIEDRLNLYPDPKDLVLWADLQKLLDKEMELEEKIKSLELPLALTFDADGGEQRFQMDEYGAQLGVASSLHELVQAASGHYTLKDKVIDLERELRVRLESLDRKGIPDDLLERLNLLESGLQQLHNEVNKDKELLTGVKKNLEEIQEDLDNRLSSIQSDHDELQEVQEKIEILEEKKADKEALEMEINVKADKKALEAKVSRALLDATAQQLNAMMQELLNKVCAQEKDWQKVLEKLLCDMDCKLDRMELDPLKKQLEERWKQLKKQLKSGPGFEADSAAGFRKQLLERFKCISCAKSTRMLPGPHLITVAASALHSRIRPTTAPELDSVKGQRGGMYGEYYDHISRNSTRPCGGSHTVTGPISRRNNRNLNLQTVYQYGDPSGGYRKEEVEIQGIDGIMYKGRLDPKLPMVYQSQETEAPTVEKKASGTNAPSSRQENDPPGSTAPRCIYCHQTSSSPRSGDLCNTNHRQEIGTCRCSGTGSRDFSASAPRDVCATIDVSNVCRCPGGMSSPAPINGQDPAASDRARQEQCAGRGPVKVFCPQNGNVDCPRPSTAGCLCPERAAAPSDGEPPNPSQPPPS